MWITSGKYPKKALLTKFKPVDKQVDNVDKAVDFFHSPVENTL